MREEHEQTRYSGFNDVAQQYYRACAMQSCGCCANALGLTVPAVDILYLMHASGTAVAANSCLACMPRTPCVPEELPVP